MTWNESVIFCLECDTVCCLGSKTYGSLCQVECDGFSETQCPTEGTCEDLRICTMEYRPLCCNGKTYSNPCMAEADGIDEPAERQEECSIGECDRAVCAADYDTLCCRDVTYCNECMAKAAGFDNPVVDCKEGRCDHSY